MISFTDQSDPKTPAEVTDPKNLPIVAHEITKRAYDAVQVLTQLQRLNPAQVGFGDLRNIVGNNFATNVQARELREQFISGYKMKAADLRTEYMAIAVNSHISEADAKKMFENIEKKAQEDLDKPPEIQR